MSTTSHPRLPPSQPPAAEGPSQPPAAEGSSLLRAARGAIASSLTLSLLATPLGCVSLTPQLAPTDVQTLEQLEDREQREDAYAANVINREKDARGVRYVKGERIGARPRSWQSLDLILRSDRNSAAALPEKQLRAARVLTGLIAVSAIVMVGGIAASAREGLDLSRLTGTGAILLTGGILTVGFGIGAGITWGRAKAGYERAVDVYNDSLGLRLGIYDADGAYVPPPGVLVDEEGFIILDQKELSVPQPHSREPEPEPEPPRTNPPLELPGTSPGSEGVEGPVADDPAPEGATTPPEQPSARASLLVGPARQLRQPGLEGVAPSAP